MNTHLDRKQEESTTKHTLPHRNFIYNPYLLSLPPVYYLTLCLMDSLQISQIHLLFSNWTRNQDASMQDMILYIEMSVYRA